MSKHVQDRRYSGMEPRKKIYLKRRKKFHQWELCAILWAMWMPEITLIKEGPPEKAQLAKMWEQAFIGIEVGGVMSHGWIRHLRRLLAVLRCLGSINSGQWGRSPSRIHTHSMAHRSIHRCPKALSLPVEIRSMPRGVQANGRFSRAFCL